MDCKDMIELFNKCGGLLYCDYVSNRCTVLHTNLKCSIKSNDDSLAIDRLLWQHMNENNVSLNKKDSTEKITKYHRFQNPDARSFTINTLESKYY